MSFRSHGTKQPWLFPTLILGYFSADRNWTGMFRSAVSPTAPLRRYPMTPLLPQYWLQRGQNVLKLHKFNETFSLTNHQTIYIRISLFRKEKVPTKGVTASQDTIFVLHHGPTTYLWKWAGSLEQTKWQGHGINHTKNNKDNESTEMKNDKIE